MKAEFYGKPKHFYNNVGALTNNISDNMQDSSSSHAKTAKVKDSRYYTNQDSNMDAKDFPQMRVKNLQRSNIGDKENISQKKLSIDRLELSNEVQLYLEERKADLMREQLAIDEQIQKRYNAKRKELLIDYLI